MWEVESETPSIGQSNGASRGQGEDSTRHAHGDVFRTPSHSLLLSVFLGNGAQLFVMTGFTIVFALLGFLSPSNRGSLGTIGVLLYTVLGFVGGYTSARVYKSMQGEKWKLNIVLTPLLVPGIVFSTFFLLDLFLCNFLLGLDSAEEDVEPDGTGVQCLQDGRMVSGCLSRTLKLGLTGS